jgi:PAS domain S-box-containing protein
MARRVAEHAPALLVYLDADLRVRFVNRHLVVLLGRTPREIRGRSLADLLDPDTLRYALAHMAEVERGNLAPRDYVLRDKRGESKVVQVRAAPDRNSRGRRVGFFACTGHPSGRRRLDPARRQLVAAANHHLRTPLASIIAALDLIRDGAQQPAETLSFAGVALQNAQRLARVVEQWLDAERIDLGAARMRHEPLDLRATLRAALTDSSAFATERGVRLQARAGGAVPSSGDPERLRQALTHLILNAVERSPFGAAVCCEVESRDHGARVLIEDQGMQPFTSRDLGVSLATAIVEQLGGTVSHGPRAGGPGAVLHVVLPRAAHP